jgi:hypothetical protein
MLDNSTGRSPVPVGQMLRPWHSCMDGNEPIDHYGCFGPPGLLPKTPSIYQCQNLVTMFWAARRIFSRKAVPLRRPAGRRCPAPDRAGDPDGRGRLRHGPERAGGPRLEKGTGVSGPVKEGRSGSGNRVDWSGAVRPLPDWPGDFRLPIFWWPALAALVDRG